MNFFRITLETNIKKPFFIIYLGIVALIASLVNFFVPIEALLRGYFGIVTDSFSETVIYLSKELYRFKTIPYVALIALLVAVIIAVLSALVFSGYFHMLYNSLKGNENKKNDYKIGLKTYFPKLSLIFFEFYISLMGFILAIPLALIPSIIIADRALENGSSSFFNTEFFYLITGVILVIMLIIIVSSFVYKFPSIFIFKKKPLDASKVVLSDNYWFVFGMVALFIVFFAMGEYLIFNISNEVITLFASFIFHTAFFAFLIGFSFDSYYSLLQQYKID